MRAVFYERQGPAAEVLALGELPLPRPGPGMMVVLMAKPPLAAGVQVLQEALDLGR